VREALDVVEVCRASGDGEPLGLGLEGVHRDRDAVGRQLVQDGGQPPLFAGRGDRLGVRVAGGRAKFDDVGTLGPQPASVRERVIWGEVRAAVREGVLGDVDDADHAGLSLREQRVH